MKSYLKDKDIKPVILLALREDIGDGDITTNAIFEDNGFSDAKIVAKQEGIFCGGDIIAMVYEEIDPSVKISILKKDGKRISKGEIAAELYGRTKSILTGERTCLNFIQRTSGIATETARIMNLLKGTNITVLDTRKTAPGMRLVDKYAVKCGGGRNHRIGLFDMILIKDNHIDAAGSITEAVKRVKTAYADKYKIEVETRTLDEVKEAVACNIDVIMLDNMDIETMRLAVQAINKKTKIEVSGNVTEARINDLRGLDIDYISIGALTHSVKAFDLSMLFE